MATGDRPVYSLQCDIAGCGYDIRCNDAPLLIKPQAMPVTVELPLNAWIKNGNNSITVAITPPNGGKFDEDTAMEFQVYRRQVGESRESRQEVSKFSCKFKDATPDTAATTLRTDGGYLFTQNFSAAVPFPESSWFSGLPIAADDQTREQIFRFYLNFHHLLRAKNTEAVMNLLRHRIAELSAAYYDSVENQTSTLREQFTRLFSEPTAELRDIQLTAHLKIYGSSKLVRLELSNGESPIYFLLTKFNVAQYVSIVLTRSQAGEWTIIR